MPITYSNNWETKYYGDIAKVELIKIWDELMPEMITEIKYSTYTSALNKKCQICSEIKSDVTIKHQNTAYTDGWKNYLSICDDCQEDQDKQWQELWDDYYSSRL